MPVGRIRRETVCSPVLCVREFHEMLTLTVSFVNQSVNRTVGERFTELKICHCKKIRFWNIYTLHEWESMTFCYTTHRPPFFVAMPLIITKVY